MGYDSRSTPPSLADICLVFGAQHSLGRGSPGSQLLHAQLQRRNPHAILSSAMPEFVIEREIAGIGQMSEDEIRDVSVRSLEVLKSMGSQIQWLHSYVTDDRLYCVYLAPDEASIRQHARQLGVPANRISAVRRLIDPQKYA